MECQCNRCKAPEIGAGLYDGFFDNLIRGNLTVTAGGPIYYLRNDAVLAQNHNYAFTGNLSVVEDQGGV